MGSPLCRAVALMTLLSAAWASPAGAQPEAPPPEAPQPESISGRWRVGDDQASFRLERCPDTAAYKGQVKSPRKGRPHLLTLTHVEGDRWTLVAKRRVKARSGLSHRVLGRQALEEVWEQVAEVPLLRSGPLLSDEDGTWQLLVPDAPSASADDAVAPVDSAALPVVRVLLTGFDRFPRPRNHPRWVMDRTADDQREPAINPSGWVVRRFQTSDLGEGLRREVVVELHKCLDVPVNYVEGAQFITDAIARIQPDVVISFGVGADGGADADVETTCSNTMDDSSEAFDADDPGPFRLPAGWPPAGESSTWSEADRIWLLRYPDNAGVSYNGLKIDPQGPETLTSLLPVDRIVARVGAEGLRGIDGGWGPGRYICNNVMYKVIQTQAARGRLGGFIHLASWSERRQESYVRVVACAVEESVRAFVEQQRGDALPPASLARASGE